MNKLAYVMFRRNRPGYNKFRICHLSLRNYKTSKQGPCKAAFFFAFGNYGVLLICFNMFLPGHFIVMKYLGV